MDMEETVDIVPIYMNYDILLLVFRFLSIGDRIKMRAVCKYWFDIVTSPSLWHSVSIPWTSLSPSNQFYSLDTLDAREIIKFTYTDTWKKEVSQLTASHYLYDFLLSLISNHVQKLSFTAVDHPVIIRNDENDDEEESDMIEKEESHIITTGLFVSPSSKFVLHFVRKCKYLRELDIRGVNPINIRFESFTEGILSHITHLDFRGCGMHINNRFLSTILSLRGEQLISLKIGITREKNFGIEQLLTIGINSDTVPALVNKINTKEGTKPRFKNLEQLWMPGCFSLDVVLMKILENIESPLSDLYLMYDRVRDNHTTCIAHKFAHNIRELNIRACGVGDAGIEQIAIHCPNLTRINVGCTYVTTKSILQLIKCCPNITYLDLCYCTKIIESNKETINNLLLQISTLLPHLTMIGLGGFRSVTDEFFEGIMERFTSLNHMGIGGMELLGSRAITSIANRCPGLTDLNAHKMGVYFGFEQFKEEILQKCLSLLSVVVLGSVGFTSEQMEFIHKKYNHESEDW